MKRLATALLVGLLVAADAAAQSAELAARSRAASAAMNEGRYDEAAGIYAELAKALPRDPGLLMNLGMALAMAGREADAIEPLERAIAMNPKLLPAHLFLGSSYLARGEFAKAVAPLKRVVTAQPSDVESRRMLSQAYAALGQRLEAVTHLRRITEVAPKLPAGWYALGHGYNALTQETIATFDDEPPDSPWRQLLLADALHADGRLTDAFALYREALKRLPAMVTIRDSIAAIYERTGHPDWAIREKRKGVLAVTACATRKALCEFRAKRYRAALTAALGAADSESRYWRVRAANELALAAFAQLDKLPDSRERREVRATLARSQRRYVDAIAELEAALKFAPGDPGLLDDLGTSYYLARDYERAVATLAPVLKATPDEARLLTVYGDSLLHLQRVDEALPFLRRAVEVSPSDSMASRTLGRAYVQKGDFAAAIPLIEPHLPDDQDGSLHVQLARAYAATGQQEKSAALLQRSQEVQRLAQERADSIARRTITAPD
jgi:tetratricopeptide (TPR) repeat protein